MSSNPRSGNHGSDKEHYFHAEARALQGRLNLPFEQEIKQQAFVKLEGKLAELTEEKRRQRNYFSQHAKNFRLEGIVSYSAAHTQVSDIRARSTPAPRSPWQPPRWKTSMS